INGSVVDYVTTPMGGGFKVENPNAVKSCGCGSSFSTDEDAAGQTLTGGCGSCGSH
ncbi:MAG: iron-sulfur cluster assembly accessory protein, partial [bacterium]